MRRLLVLLLLISLITPLMTSPVAAGRVARDCEFFNFTDPGITPFIQPDFIFFEEDEVLSIDTEFQGTGTGNWTFTLTVNGPGGFFQDSTIIPGGVSFTAPIEGIYQVTQELTGSGDPYLLHYTCGFEEEGEEDEGPQPGPPCANLDDGRINNDISLDCGAPIAIYINGSNVEIYAIDPQTGNGTLSLVVPLADLQAGDVPTDQHTQVGQSTNMFIGKLITLHLLTSGEIQVSTQYADGKAYIVSWPIDDPEALYHIAA